MPDAEDINLAAEISEGMELSTSMATIYEAVAERTDRVSEVGSLVAYLVLESVEAKRYA